MSHTYRSIVIESKVYIKDIEVCGECQNVKEKKVIGDVLNAIDELDFKLINLGKEPYISARNDAGYLADNLEKVLAQDVLKKRCTLIN